MYFPTQIFSRETDFIVQQSILIRRKQTPH